MKFDRIEHYDHFDTETVFWADISDMPEVLQSKAREIDGAEFNPSCFGVCVIYDWAKKEFDLIVDVDPATGEYCNVYYIDTDGEKHWFKTELTPEFTQEIFAACGKGLKAIQENKTHMPRKGAKNAMDNTKLVSFNLTGPVINNAVPANVPDKNAAEMTITGYPSSESCPGQIICRVYTVDDDIFTQWVKPEYKDDPQVDALYQNAVDKLNKWIAGEAVNATPPKIQIIVRDGVLTDVRLPKGLVLDIEAVQIDKDYPDYEQLCQYESALYDNDGMYSADFDSVNFEQDS